MAGGLAGGLANVVCYPFDFARTRLASDLGSGKGQFNGIMDCITKTVQTGGITGLYRGSAITVAGAFVYRGGQLGLFAQIQDMNPYKTDKGMVGIYVYSNSGLEPIVSNFCLFENKFLSNFNNFCCEISGS